MATYPIVTPQGATVLIYGHENGIKLVWRGGQRLKAASAPPKPTERSDGSSNARNGGQAVQPAPSKPPVDVMVLDSDEDEPAPVQPAQPAPQAKATTPAFVDKAEFEPYDADLEQELLLATAGSVDQQAALSYPDVVQTLDLPLMTAVLHIAVPGLTPCGADDVPVDAPLLRERMVFAAACASGDVYLFAVPLTPPSHASKARPELAAELLAGRPGSGIWGETMLLLGLQGRHSTALALTLTSHRTAAASSQRSKSADRRASSVTTGPAGAASPASPAPGTTPQQQAAQARLVVASSTREASGTMRLWDVPLTVLKAPSKPDDKPRPVEPFQTEYLPGPITTLAFNPSRPTQLLAAFSPQGVVRLYDYALASVPQDEPVSSSGGLTPPWPSQGSWLLSLYTPFIRPPAGSLPSTFHSAASFSTLRIPLLDVAWIAHGRALLALLAEGTWGIWDIDGLGPSIGGSHTTPSLTLSAGIDRTALQSGIKGGALTQFAVHGHLEGTNSLRIAAPPIGSIKKSSMGGGPGEFVPLTPGTRSANASFSGATGGSAAASFSAAGPGMAPSPPVITPATEHARLSTLRGAVHVQPLPTFDAGSRHRYHHHLDNDEAAVLFLSTGSAGSGSGELVTVIPAVARFWEAQRRKKNATSAAGNGKEPGSAGTGGSGSIPAGGFNLFSESVPATRMVRLHDLSVGLGGERVTGISSVVRGFAPRSSGESGGGHGPSVLEGGSGGDDDGRLPIDVLVRGETRLVAVRESPVEGPGTRIGGVVGWKGSGGVSKSLRFGRRSGGAAADEAEIGTPRVSAIAVEGGARRDRATSAAFNLMVRKDRSLAAAAGLEEDEGRAGDEGPPADLHLPTRTRAPAVGLAFAENLSQAADATGAGGEGGIITSIEEGDMDHDVVGAEPFGADRNIEEEMLDIMDIERTLEQMEDERDLGSKKVFFEDL